MKDRPLHKPLLGVALATGLLLLIPAIAMQFTREVSWGLGDFAVAAALLFAAGTLIVIAARGLKNRAHRALAIASVGAGLLLVWAELAGGLFH
jgi:hypothetical protein